MDLKKLNRLFDRAVAANWLDSHREGYLIRLPKVGDVMYTGDIHGSMRNFAAILKLAALEENPKRHLIIQEVTHQLEMGEDKSYLVLEKTAALKAKYPDRVHVLMGNHELAEIQGREIFKGGLCLNLLFENALEKAYGECKETVRTKYIEFIKTLPLAAVTETGIFMAHSTPDGADIKKYRMEFFAGSARPQDFEKSGPIEKLVWGRDYDQKTADALAERLGVETFLVGHAPCARGYEVPNTRHIILDAKDRFATYLIFDLEKPVTHEELKKGIHYINSREPRIIDQVRSTGS